VIVVIGILATLTAISYAGIQAGTRDSQRTKDVTQLKIALEKYHADNGSYPQACSGDNGNNNVTCAVTNLASSLQPYLATIPTDPSATAGSTQDYQYVRGPVNNDSYGIFINYEKATDCTAGQHVDNTWFSSAPTCTNF
jgi:type II secretory pathway pseudopilin PulG